MYNECKGERNVAKRKKKLPVASGEMLDFVVILERPETGTLVRYIEQFSPYNPATGQLYNRQEFGESLLPYVSEVSKKFKNWNTHVVLATNEEIEELSANLLDNSKS
jgi:hypothetical protein